METPESEPILARLAPAERKSAGGLLSLWFGVLRPVPPLAYAVSGFGLMLLKYSVEAAAIGASTGKAYTPLDFVNPQIDSRRALFQGGPEWLPWSMFVWTLPFLWISVTMSVRRAANAGNSPWLGMLVLIPGVNLLFMLLMCIMPTQLGDGGFGRPERTDARGRALISALAVGIGLTIGAVMIGIGVLVFRTYGAALFLGTPLMMAATASYYVNRRAPQSYGASLGLGMLTVSFACLALLLVALEGLICIAMALPLALPLGILGGLLGKAIADTARSNSRGLVAAILILPLVSVGEAWIVRAPERMVLTSVEVDAPPAVVWKNVVEFPDLPPDTSWFAAWGLASPLRATIAGRGVGAIRHCEFTTGAFVEPITAWEQPNRLAFDVTEQPPPLKEMSPYDNVHPPHLAGFLISTHGEFRLIELPGQRTRLEGRTWYRNAMFPQWYWAPWSDSIIHRIHQRVLQHVQHVTEAELQAQAAAQ